MEPDVEKDHSILGRERYLSRTFFMHRAFDTVADFAFARQTLLQGIINKFAPESYYCSLDGFDMLAFQRFPHGFIAGGWVWYLNESERDCKLPIIMAVEFNIQDREIKRARTWISLKSSKDVKPIDVRFSKLEEAFSVNRVIGSDWKHAFYRRDDSWHMDDGLDFSIMLRPM